MSRLLAQWNFPLGFLQELVEYGAPTLFAKNDSLYLRGSTGDVAYLVISGAVKVSFPLPDGKSVVVNIAGPGDFIGTVDSLEGERRIQAFDAQALTKVSAAIFSRGRILSLLSKFDTPELVNLIERLNSSWSELFVHCATFLGLSYRERLRQVLRQLASRFGVRDSRGLLLTLEPSHEELAEMIASSRPLVTRLIAEFIKRGELIRRGRRYIVPSTVLPPSTDIASPGWRTNQAGENAGSHREAAGDSTGRERAWDAFVKDKSLQRLHNITPEEMGILSQVAMMGNARVPDDFLFMLKIIRTAAAR